MNTNQKLARSRYLDRASTILAHGASVFLVLMMCTVFIGVVLRYAFNAPILGSNEIIELMSVGVVMLGIPYCASQDSHIRIDLLDDFIGPTGRAFGDFIYRVMGTIVLGFMAERTLRKMFDTLKFEDSTNMLGIPIWPLYALITAGMGLYIVILIAQLVAQTLRLDDQDG